MSFFSDFLSIFGRGNSNHIENAEFLKEYIADKLGEVYSTLQLKMPQSGDPLTVIIVGPTKVRTFQQQMNTTRGVKEYTTNLTGDQYLLITSGMSDKPLPGSSNNYCELMIGLPSTWQAPKSLDDLASLSPDDLYPLNMLIKLAEIPRLMKQSISYGDTLPLGEGSPNGRFNTVIIDAPTLPDIETPSIHRHIPMPHDLKEIRTGATGYITFYGVIPITDQEAAEKERMNTDFLLRHLNSSGVGLIFDINRESTAS